MLVIWLKSLLVVVPLLRMVSIAGARPIAESKESIPCLEEEYCQRPFGTRSEDVAHFGNIPPCQQYGWVRCLVARRPEEQKIALKADYYSYGPTSAMTSSSRPDSYPSSSNRQYLTMSSNGMAQQKSIQPNRHQDRIKESSFQSASSAHHSVQLDGQSFSFDIRLNTSNDPEEKQATTIPSVQNNPMTQRHPFAESGERQSFPTPPSLPVIQDQPTQSARGGPQRSFQNGRPEGFVQHNAQQIPVRMELNQPSARPAHMNNINPGAAEPIQPIRSAGNPQQRPEPIHEQSFQLNLQQPDRPAAAQLEPVQQQPARPNINQVLSGSIQQRVLVPNQDQAASRPIQHQSTMGSSQPAAQSNRRPTAQQSVESAPGGTFQSVIEPSRRPQPVEPPPQPPVRPNQQLSGSIHQASFPNPQRAVLRPSGQPVIEPGQQVQPLITESKFQPTEPAKDQLNFQVARPSSRPIITTESSRSASKQPPGNANQPPNGSIGQPVESRTSSFASSGSAAAGSIQQQRPPGRVELQEQQQPSAFRNSPDDGGLSIPPSDRPDQQTIQQIFDVLRAALSSSRESSLNPEFSASSGSPALTPIGPLPLEPLP